MEVDPSFSTCLDFCKQKSLICGSRRRKNSIQTEVSISTLAKAIVSMAQFIGSAGKLHLSGHGLDAAQLA